MEINLCFQWKRNWINSKNNKFCPVTENERWSSWKLYSKNIISDQQKILAQKILADALMFMKYEFSWFIFAFHRLYNFQRE